MQSIHVLLIDDSEPARNLIRAALEFGDAIVTATTAADAHRVSLIADVIVCDLVSAERTGEDLLRRLRALHNRQGRTVPAIALVPSPEHALKSRAMGFERYLLKPVHGDALRAAVRELIYE